MSKKYMIDLPNDAQYILVNGACDNKCYTRIDTVEDLEELTEECINDLSVDLQARAYNRGINDAREGINVCNYCEYQCKGINEKPCKNCCNSYENKFICRKQEINVGDIVEDLDGDEILITRIFNDRCEGIYSDGATVLESLPLEKLIRTGRRVDIEVMLKEMTK